MTHLQAEFSKEADAKVKTLIDDQVSIISATQLSSLPLAHRGRFQFEGDLEYVTVCQKCRYKSSRTGQYLLPGRHSMLNALSLDLDRKVP